MRLIIEISNDTTFVYREMEKEFKINEPQRQATMTLIDWEKSLGVNECNLSAFGDNVYTVVPVRSETRKRLNRRRVRSGT